MLKTRRRFGIPTVLAALAVATGLVAGCSSGGSSSNASLPDAPGLLQQASANTKTVTSAHLEIVVDKVEGLPVKTLSGDLTNVPAVAVQGNAKITMSGSDLDVGLVVIDGTLYASLTPNSWLDMGPAADIYDPSAILNPNTGLANVLANFSDAKSESTETINGVETVKVSGTVSQEAVDKLLPQLKITKAVPGTAWIEKDGDHRLVQAQIQPNDGGSIQITLSDWNKPVTVTKPAV